MKLKKIIMMMLVVALLAAQTAFAGSSLSAVLSDGILEIKWEAEGPCVLTVYRNNWPISVCNVDGASGGTQVRVRQEGNYSMRLKTPTGCETAKATVESGATSAPTAQSTPVPTADPTATPTLQPTAEPTMAPTAVPTVAPTKVPATAAPTVKPTAVPTKVPATVAPTQRPTIAPTATAPSQGGQSMTSLAAQVITQVNAERAKYGLPELSMSAELTRAACVRANEIVEQFSHTRPDGSSWSTVSGSAMGENIAKGQNSADRVMAAWMSSDGHRANILRESFGSIGVCALQVNGVIHWVQLFGK